MRLLSRIQSRNSTGSCGARSPGVHANHPALAVLDADHDGEISESEIANSSSALRRLDRNLDGSLTPDELIPSVAAMQAAMIMVRLDANGDGVVSPQEQESEDAQLVREVLQSADRNHDGRITWDELRMELRLRSERKREFDSARRAAGLRE